MTSSENKSVLCRYRFDVFEEPDNVTIVRIHSAGIPAVILNAIIIGFCSMFLYPLLYAVWLPDDPQPWIVKLLICSVILPPLLYVDFYGIALLVDMYRGHRICIDRGFGTVMFHSLWRWSTYELKEVEGVFIGTHKRQTKCYSMDLFIVVRNRRSPVPVTRTCMMFKQTEAEAIAFLADAVERLADALEGPLLPPRMVPLFHF